ncbi:MAG: DUF3618 domain-containing protein [Pyrinomonadaceae bacterium]
MAEERNDIENIDRVDANDRTPAGTTDSLARGQSDVGDDTDQTDQLKDQIEETRSQMGETIDAIQDKLSFINLSEQVSEHVNNAVETAKVAVYDATIGKAANIMKNLGDEFSGSSIVNTAKNNPFPFILIGLGAGLLAYRSYSGKGGKKRVHHLEVAGRDPRESEGNESHTDSPLNKLMGVTDKGTGAAGTAYDKVSGAVGTAYSGAGEAVSQAYGKVGELGTTVRGKYDTHIEENPLAVGAVALALGAAVGMAIPSTKYEGEWMGNARQELVDKAQTTAADLIDKTKEAVTDAGRSLADQARSAITE